MSDLPAGWRWSVLDELRDAEPGAVTDGPFGSKLTSAHYSSNGARVVRLQNIGEGVYRSADAFIPWSHFEVLRKHEVRANDLLIASLGDAPPRACLAPESLGPAIVKADCVRVRLSDEVDSRWVMYAMQSPALKGWAREQLHGVGRPRLGLKTIRRLPIPLPPLAEQRRLVDLLEGHLSRLDAAEAELTSASQRVRAMQTSVVRRELTAADVPGPRANQLGHADADDGDLPLLPDGWWWARLGELADVVGGVTKDAKKQAAADAVDVPYLRVANVQRGRLDLREVTRIRVPRMKAEALRLLPGDVLLNEGGDRDKLGRGWVWQGEVDDCIHQNHVFRARVRDEALDPYLLSWAGNYIGGAWCERNGRQSVNLASISLSRIRLMPVPVPPRDLQSVIRERIGTVFEAGARLEAAMVDGQKRSAGLRRALLEAAFSGRLTGRSLLTEIVEELEGQQQAAPAVRVG